MSIPRKIQDLSAVAALLLSVAMLSPYASGQAPAQVLSSSNSVSPAPSLSTASPKAAPAIDDRYVIGADDVLAIDVWHEQELSRVLPVRPDGKISLPLIGELAASGKTPLQLENLIAQSLKDYLEHPQVTIIVQDAKSQTFNVMGEVQRPGSYTFGHPVTVLDAVALAGGFRDFAKSKRIYVLRTRADGSHQSLAFNYNEVIKGKKLSQNIVLQPHDTVVVP